MSTDDVVFFLNGEKFSVTAPDPGMMLIDFMRQPSVGLAGPKKPCGQGGCGSCTVVLSHWDADKKKPMHHAINSCLRPIAALNGLSVTTVEGTGSVETEMNPVAHALAENNGTQCGYCTNGWVMAMTGFLANDPPPQKLTKKNIESLFDGNLCRCTGYRSILEGMKTFATDLTEKDKANRMKCVVDPTFNGKVKDRVTIPFGPDQNITVENAEFDHGSRCWIEVSDAEAAEAAYVAASKAKKKPRFVHGNTSFGIYKGEVQEADVLIDIRNIAWLNDFEKDGQDLLVGAGLTYATLLENLDGVGLNDGTPLGAVKYMARRTAGMLVRNAATLGGNTMLVHDHIHQGEPFPSDLVTALCGLNAKVDYINLANKKHLRAYMPDWLRRAAARTRPLDPVLLVRYHIPMQVAGTVFAQKAALREVNSHSIVNWCSVIDAEGPQEKAAFKSARIFLNGIGPVPFQAVETEKALIGQPANEATIAQAETVMAAEVAKEMARWDERMDGLPDEGFTDAYRTSLACGFLKKACLNAMIAAGLEVPDGDVSAGTSFWDSWGASGGTQSYQKFPYEHPVSEPYIKLMAMYQAQGEVRYTHETRPPAGTVFGALVASPVATGTFRLVDRATGKEATASELRSRLQQDFSGFRELVTSVDVPGKNLQGMGNDQPLFLPVGERVMYQGQSLAMVLAETQSEALTIAAWVESHFVKVEDVGQPLLTIEEAYREEMVFPDCPLSADYLAHIWKVTRKKSDLSWSVPTTPLLDKASADTVELKGVSCTRIVTPQSCGGQLHFYMETQSAIAEPEDGNTMLVLASTQSPKAVQGSVADALGFKHNQIGIKVPQVGGAYGGKTEQSRFTAAMAAVAAHKIGKPVYFALEREDDSAMIGKRHPYRGVFQLAVDNGASNPKNKGLIRGLKADMWGDGGAYYDCSFVVSDCMQLRVDSAYYVKNYETVIDVLRTNTSPNTAYRAFGDIQATLMLESAIEDAAVQLEMDAADLREKNLYDQGQTTPSGQKLEYCYQKEVWKYCRKQSKYDRRLKKVRKFNSENKWRKRGICLMPLKYGSGFNLIMLEQTTALVSIYGADGTILIRQGGVDMGQGMVTKLAQIAAYELNVPIDIVRIDTADTRVIANPSSTGASTGTQYNGLAIKNACDELRARLKAYCRKKGAAWCAKIGIADHKHADKEWNGINKNGKSIWSEVIGAAFQDRINLQAQANAVVPGGTRNADQNLTFKTFKDQHSGTGIPIKESAAFSEPVQEYVGFTYNAACVEVEVDILTGETKIRHATIVYDMGKSMNPAIDVGQIEGAFMQGIGYVMTENVVYQPDGPNVGRLNTDNTWRYKPPAISTVPTKMHVKLFPRSLAEKIPVDPNSLFSSKEVGEPPMVLANAAFFAIKSAVRAYRDGGKDDLFSMTAPATVQTVAMACKS